MPWWKGFLCLLMILANSRSLQVNDEHKNHEEIQAVTSFVKNSSDNTSLTPSRRLVTIAERRAAKMKRTQVTVKRIEGKQCPYILKGRCESKRNDPTLAPWDLLESGSAALNALEKLRGLRIGGLGDSVAEQAYHALHCYVDTATKPAPRIQYSSHKQRPPNGLNVTFPAFVHLPTVLLNQSALKDYLIGALKGIDVVMVSIGTWYDWQSTHNASSLERSYSKSGVVSPPATAEEVLAEAHVIDANLTGRLLKSHCLFANDAQRAAFKSSMYEEVWEGALPGRAKRNSVRRRAGCLTLLGPSAYASDLRRFADVVHEVRREERASGTRLLPNTFVWKDVAPQHFAHEASGRFEWGVNVPPKTPPSLLTSRLPTEPPRQVHNWRTVAEPLMSSLLTEEKKPSSLLHDRNASQCGPVRDVKLAYERNAIADAVLKNARRVHDEVPSPASSSFSSSSSTPWFNATGVVVARSWEQDLGAHQGHVTDYGAHDQNAAGPDCTHYCNPSATTRRWAEAMASAMAESMEKGQSLM